MKPARLLLAAFSSLLVALAAGGSPLPEVQVSRQAHDALAVEDARLTEIEPITRYRAQLGIRNDSGAFLDEVLVAYEIWSASDQPRGGGLIVLEGLLGPHETGRFDVELAMRTPAEGDRVVFRHAGLSPAKVIGTCEGFCQMCGEIASSLCGSQGIASFSCQCGEVNRTCNFSCNPQ